MIFSSFLRILLSIILFNEFIVLFDSGFFSLQGFEDRIRHLAGANQVSANHYILLYIANHASIFYRLPPAFLFITSVLGILGLWVRPAIWSATCIFVCYFTAHTGVPGTWAFMYVIPCVLSYLVSRHLEVNDHAKSSRLYHDFPDLSLGFSVGIFSIGALFIYWINIASKNIIHQPKWVASLCAISVLLLLITNKVLTYFIRLKHPSKAVQGEQVLIDKCTILLGIMLTMQVHMNALLNWFTLKGFHHLINVYQGYSSLPHWALSFTSVVDQYNLITMPMQASLEAFLATCLIILAFRPVIFTMSAFLFMALALIEMGVPATFPVTFPIEYTWTYELLLSALVMIGISLSELRRSFASNDLATRWLGPPVFPKMLWGHRFASIIIISILIFTLLWMSHNLNNELMIFSLETTITALCYLSLFHLLDAVKTHYSPAAHHRHS